MSSLKVESEYAPGDELPPTVMTDLSTKSHRLVRRVYEGHRKDGTNDDPLIAHAFATVNEAGGVYFVVANEGFASITRIGLGWLRAVLNFNMADEFSWMVKVWPTFVLPGPPSTSLVHAYEERSGGAPAKTLTTVDFVLFDAQNGARIDRSFCIGAYGIREGAL